MRKFYVENLGPIDGKFEMDLDKKLTIIIGEQATGKSTIATALYYYIHKSYVKIGKNMSIRGLFEITTRMTDMDEHFYKSYGTENKVFLEERDEERLPLYMPAGRSMIPFLFDDYVAATKMRMDPFFYETLTILNMIRKDHDVSMVDILDVALKNPELSVDENNIRIAIDQISKILKGQYRYSKGNERFFYSDDQSVPIKLASSGQQEMLYICMLLFDVLLHNLTSTIIIEEPESHVFPSTQKLFMELLARVINTTGSHVVITTHSPYILTSANLLIHSAKVENKIDNHKIVIDPMTRIDPETIDAFLLERNGNFTYRNIIDKETDLIAASEIDTVSEQINQSISELVDLEVKHGL